MDKLKNYILANFKFVLTIVIVIGIQTVLNFIPPSLIRNITSSIERNKTVFSIKTQFIIIILVVLSVYLLKLLLNYLNLRFSLYFKTNNSKNLYNSLFKMDFGSIQKLEPSYFVSRIKGTVDNIFKLIGSNISKVIISSLTLIISILLIIKINTLIAFLFLLLLFVHYFSYKKLNKKLERESITLQEISAQNFKNTINVIQNIQLIKQINNNEEFANIIGNYIKKIEKKNFQVNLFASNISAVIDLILNVFKITILLLSIYFYMINNITFADILFISMISNIYFQALTDLTRINLSLRDVRASLNFVKKEMLENEEGDSGKLTLKSIKAIEFKIKKFCYKDNIVLKDIYFNIEGNQTLGIAGYSGSGKSTLTKLLIRLYSVNGIYINSLPINEYTLSSLRNKIYIVNQDNLLFPGSIEENIVIGLENYKRSRLEEIKSMKFLSFINSLPEKYNTYVKEKGDNLSGGQKQKIAIARMIMHNSEVIIFDEATSALDSKSESEIFEEINPYLTNKIIIKISHRLSSLKEADKLLIINNGIIEAIGNHEELVKRREYNNLFHNQIIINE